MHQKQKRLLSLLLFFFFSWPSPAWTRKSSFQRVFSSSLSLSRSPFSFFFFAGTVFFLPFGRSATTLLRAFLCRPVVFGSGDTAAPFLDGRCENGQTSSGKIGFS